jgi:hypothetical protein
MKKKVVNKAIYIALFGLDVYYRAPDWGQLVNDIIKNKM